jgi:hypothetical protein
MDQQGRGAMSDASTGAETTLCPPGVAVYDSDGEQLGTVSDWQDMHNFLIVHQGRLFGHDTYVPHAAIKYSDMNGVHLRLRHGDLTSMKQPPLPEHAAPISTISMALPILVPDMGVAAVAAMAFADDATPPPAPASSSAAQLAIEATHEQAMEHTVQAGPIPERGKSRRLLRHSKR